MEKVGGMAQMIRALALQVQSPAGLGTLTFRGVAPNKPKQTNKPSTN